MKVIWISHESGLHKKKWKNKKNSSSCKPEFYGGKQLKQGLFHQCFLHPLMLKDLFLSPALIRLSPALLHVRRKTPVCNEAKSRCSHLLPVFLLYRLLLLLSTSFHCFPFSLLLLFTSSRCFLPTVMYNWVDVFFLKNPNHAAPEERKLLREQYLSPGGRYKTSFLPPSIPLSSPYQSKFESQ